MENEQQDTRESDSKISELQIKPNSQVNSFKENTLASDLSDHHSLDLIISNEYEPFNSAALLNFEHPTDRGHYPIDIVDPNKKKFIVAHSSCRPKGPFPREDELKFIKNYLRNSMGQERLNGLALLSIEASRAKAMEVDQLIDRFTEIKSRCKNLH